MQFLIKFISNERSAYALMCKLQAALDTGEIAGGQPRIMAARQIDGLPICAGQLLTQVLKDTLPLGRLQRPQLDLQIKTPQCCRVEFGEVVGCADEYGANMPVLTF